ncbi:MAG: PhoH family protein [Pseudomonadota bacterium]
MGRLQTADFELNPDDNIRLVALCGQCNENLSHIEKRMDVEINFRGNKFRVIGEKDKANAAQRVIEQLYGLTDRQRQISGEQVHLSIQESRAAYSTAANLDKLKSKTNFSQTNSADTPNFEQKFTRIKTKRGLIKPRGEHQAQYVSQILKNDVSFGIGPAGTGKTYLAVAAAVDALERNEVSRIILTRPAVEAGERLGFLPGDLAQKIDPYLRPLYDALYDMLGFERVAKLMERNVIEVAPLAYMRGRTLNDAFIILDESQNTTKEQMKMLLTRIGFNSKAVITGDITQVDLPRGVKSGLRQAIEILQGVDNVSFTFFTAGDVVRHTVVQAIVKAYEKFETNEQFEQRHNN